MIKGRMTDVHGLVRVFGTRGDKYEMFVPDGVNQIKTILKHEEICSE